MISFLDALLNDSPWARSKMDQDAIDKSELNFGTREQCVSYLDELLRHKMFHRAKKIPVAEKTSKKDKKEKDKGKNCSIIIDITQILPLQEFSVYNNKTSLHL